ncbi:hypothetical protein [Nitrincola sp.]|uniref:hypothetical protein n=1 Tax=Nitrincola sp. TaxID=1926584 RepID=UPI003A8FCEC1
MSIHNYQFNLQYVPSGASNASFDFDCNKSSVRYVSFIPLITDDLINSIQKSICGDLNSSDTTFDILRAQYLAIKQPYDVAYGRITDEFEKLMSFCKLKYSSVDLKEIAHDIYGEDDLFLHFEIEFYLEFKDLFLTVRIQYELPKVPSATNNICCRLEFISLIFKCSNRHSPKEILEELDKQMS